MTDVVEERGRLGIKAAIDGDPKDAIKFDIREDEEQNVKLQETVELLVVAGYFRARIKGLAAFDKVVGGMVWCISLCNIDVDVDLLYQENSTIGQKIALTERIVKVLPKMKCPHMIEPHQIQGLDFIHIFPVVQWLVKMALEAKQQMGDHVQALAASQFDSRYSLPEEQVRCKAVNKSVAVQQSIRSSGGPKRLYKKPADLQISEEDRRVHTTLLEYGWRHTNLLRSTETGETSARNAIGKPSDAQDDIDLSSLISGLSVVADSETKMSASYVASLMDNSKIKQMATKYAQKDVEPLSPSKLSSKSYSLAFDQHQTKTSTIEDLELEIENARTKMAELLNEEQNLAEAVDEEKLALEKEKLSDEEVDAEIHRISELEAKIERETATKLRELMVEHDDIRQKEKEFKDRCLLEFAALEAEIERLKSQDLPAGLDKNARRQEIETEFKREKTKLHQSRLALAQLNRQVASLQRRIDEVPSQAELNQYQKRFIELYNQVASKHRETKQFYTLHNTLLDMKAYMKREIDLLDNIYNVQNMATQEGYKMSFVRNLEQILDGVRQNKLKVERKQTEERLRRDMLRENYQEMLDKQRLYYKTVKDFQEECKKNELLHERLKEVGTD